MTPRPTAASSRLFRDEVLDASKPQLAGQILLTPRAPTWAMACFALAVALGVLALLLLGSYTRRATVTGQLQPSAGIIRVQTPQAGVVLEKHVAEGQLVKKGDVLFVLSSDRKDSGTREIQAAIGNQVQARKQSMEGEIARNRSMESGELEHWQKRAATLASEAQTVQNQIEQQKLRLGLAQDAYQRYQGLADKEYVAREQLVQKEIELSEQQSRLQALQRDALAVQRELATSQREIASTRARYANQNAGLVRNISSAEQEMTEVEARRKVVITAPESGRATLVLAEIGQVVDASRALLNVVPEGGSLEVRLYAPSRSIGFVRPGNAVLLRLQSFPYQKFGQAKGRVQSISSNAVSSAELTGLTLPDLPAGELVYAITVLLEQQSVSAYGQAIPLQAGMRVEADILQEKRRLYEWLLDPLYSVTGRMP